MDVIESLEILWELNTAVVDYLLYFTISLQEIPPPITPSLQPFPPYPFPLYTIPHSLTIYLSFLNSEKNSTVFVLL